MLDPGLSVHYESLFTEHQLDKRQLLKRCFGKIVFHCSFLVHGQVTIIFVVSCLFVCLSVQSFSQPSLIRFRSN